MPMCSTFNPCASIEVRIRHASPKQDPSNTFSWTLSHGQVGEVTLFMAMPALEGEFQAKFERLKKMHAQVLN